MLTLCIEEFFGRAFEASKDLEIFIALSYTQ
jgi:hypothetical protein